MPVMRKALPQSFFNRPTAMVAEKILGKFLVRRYRGKEIACPVIEVEIYDGLRDRGSHAHRRQTARNAPMFGAAGHWYVYFTYGAHWMLNIVTRGKGYPAALLIRCLYDPRHARRISGPGRLTKALMINTAHNAKRAAPENGLWIEDRGIQVPRAAMRRGARIGIDYAGPYWKRRKLRFYLDPSFDFKLR